MELAEEFLAIAYEKKGRSDQALGHYKRFVLYRDSLFNIEKANDITRNELKFEFEREAEKDSLENVHSQLLKDEQLRSNKLELAQHRTRIFGLLIGVVLLVLFGAFMYNRFKVTTKQKQIIEEQKLVVEQQKRVVEEQQKEIHDSINYAKRIQSSFMATEEQLSAKLKEHFVFFKPKDIVSGDFYWADTTKEDIFICVADSTGHGIPGAFMSLLNISLLNEALLSKLYTHTNDVLNFVRRVLILGLRPDESGQGGNDGMDCVLIKLNLKLRTLEYSGANNSIWLMREGKIISLDTDKMPVGRSPKQETPFSCKKTDLLEGDVLYLFTDGYPDQFGGPKGKKYKYKQLEELLVSIQQLPLKDQRSEIEQSFERWKGDLEQVDDICIMGIKI